MKTLVLLFLITSTTLYSQSTILWQVSHPESEDTSFFLGTYHYMGNGFVDTIPEALSAISQAEIGIFESLDTKESTRKLIEKRLKKDWAENELSKSQFAELEKRASTWKVNWKKLFPHEVKFKLFQQCVYVKCGNASETDSVLEMDSYVQSIFRNQNKSITGLENAQFQLEALKNSSYKGDVKEDKKLILHYLKILDSDEELEECQFAEAYKNFNLDYQFETSSSDAVLLEQRNNNWMPELVRLISNKSCFVAVGLFHLYFERGLIVQFRKLGFRVQPIFLD